MTFHGGRHRKWVAALAWLSTVYFAQIVGADEIRRFARFVDGTGASYGLVEADRVRCVEGSPLRDWKPTDDVRPLASVKLLAPVVPPKVFAVGRNYRSHLGDLPAPQRPEIFFKLPTSIVGPGDPIVIPPGADDVHFEAELVVVIGRGGKNIPASEVSAHIAGITCGNDVSARDWQKNDLQWWRAKGSDTFGPIGPYLVVGANYNDLLLTLRQNGEVRQQQRTSDLLFDVAAVVSFISRHATLEPGDVIFTGTPGKTTAIHPGDVVEVELEQVGTLTNPVRAAP